MILVLLKVAVATQVAVCSTQGCESFWQTSATDMYVLVKTLQL
jgi:hypothetical protein